MKKVSKLIVSILFVVLCILGFNLLNRINDNHNINETTISENGQYTSKEEVALYIHLYNHLPSNYITKTQAKKLGWIQEEGNLWDVTDHKSIGGGIFQNLEKILPTNKEYYECDINYDGKDRGPERLVYTKDGYIYYTSDHYQTFELLYSPEEK